MTETVMRPCCAAGERQQPITHVTIECDRRLWFGWFTKAYDQAGHVQRCRYTLTRWGARRVAYRYLEPAEVVR